MTRYLLAWELGGGLGHAAQLKPLAAGLAARGHAVSLWLRDLVQPRRLLADLPLPQLQAPVWLHRSRGVPEPPVSLAEILLGSGYLQPDDLDALVRGWLAALRMAQAQALVVDYAPTAVLAARIAGVPAACVGMGFWMPPRQVPLAPFRDWGPIEPGRVERAEQQVLASVNTVLQRHGAAPLQQLWPLFEADLPLLCTWPELDPHPRPAGAAPWQGPSLLGAGGPAPSWPAGPGPRAFAYLKAAHPDHAALLQALVAAGCRTVCYLPEVAGGLAPPVASPLLHYARAPVHLAQACSQADVVVCHGNHGTLSQALLCGVPLLLLPMQAEQFLTSRRVEQAGLGLSTALRPRPTPFAALLAALLGDSAQRRAAQAFAERHRGFDPQAQAQGLVSQLEHLAGTGAETAAAAAASAPDPR